LIILKFGGSSVGDPDRINSVIEIIGNKFNKNQRGAVVFSAYQGVTDSLVKAGQLAAKSDKKYLDIYESLKEKHLSVIRKLTIGENRKELSTLIKPLFTNPTTITVVIELDCITPVTRMPTPHAIRRLLVTALIILRSRFPATACIPSDMYRMPKRNSPNPPITLKIILQTAAVPISSFVFYEGISRLNGLIPYISKYL